MKTLKVLVIYEILPEETIKAVIEMTTDEYDYFRDANNYIINATDYDENRSDVVTVISNALCDNPDYLKYADTQEQKDYFGKWVSGRETVEKPITDLKDVERLIFCGFYL